MKFWVLPCMYYGKISFGVILSGVKIIHKCRDMNTIKKKKYLMTPLDLEALNIISNLNR